MTDNNTMPVYSKKQILSDPITFFAEQRPKASTDQKQILQTLVQQNVVLKQQLKEQQLQSKKLSRKIGEAKRNNIDISELKSTMQLLSKKVKNSSQQSAELELEILAYFQVPITVSKDKSSTKLEAMAKSGAPVFNYGKRNHVAAIAIDEISIATLNSDMNSWQDDWNSYVTQHAAGCIHHRSEWMSLMQTTYQHQCFYFAAFNKDKNIVGILPLIRLKSRLFGDLLVSMPYFQRAGAIADHPLIEQKLMLHASEQAAARGIEHIEYRDDIAREAMPVQSHKVNMVLALPGHHPDNPQDNIDTLWQSFSSKLRAQIKRPQRENPDTQIGRKELLNAFYVVYSRNMRDLGSPAHSKKFIANILQHFPENSWLIVVTLKQKPVAAALLLADGNTMEIPLASTIRDVNHLSLNMLLYWEVLKFAVTKGCQYFDFGRSTRDAGTYKFKQQWGALPQTLYWHYWLNANNKVPELNPSNPKYALLIFIWKHLPVTLANFLGPSIVKNIP